MDIGYYRVLYELKIRNTPGLTYLKLNKKIEKNDLVYIEQVDYLRHSVWGKVSEGWICMYMNHSYYVSIEKYKNL